MNFLLFSNNKVKCQMFLGILFCSQNILIKIDFTDAVPELYYLK